MQNMPSGTRQHLLHHAAHRRIHRTLHFHRFHHQQAVALLDLLIQLDGHAISLEAQLLDQRAQGQAVVKDALCPIDHDLHRDHCRASNQRQKISLKTRIG
jgi:hypothetical protein